MQPKAAPFLCCVWHEVFRNNIELKYAYGRPVEIKKIYMNILCSANAGDGQVGMYAIQEVESNVYKATLRKYTGNKTSFPGMLLLRREINNWLTFPEGYAGIVECLTSELERLYPRKNFN